MKLYHRSLTLFCLFLLFTCQSAPERPSGSGSLLRYVDPLIGTGNATTPSALLHSEGKTEAKGQTYPAVGRPNGMTHFSPQTRATEEKCLPPYYYADSLFQGIRATHWMSGSCTQDYGSFTLMPRVGELQWNPQERALPFSHEQETASPDCYRLAFPEHDFSLQVTASERCGLMEVDFGGNASGWFIIEPNSDEGEAYLRIDAAAGKIYGYNPVHRIYQGWGDPAGFSGHFVLEFSQPFAEYGCWRGNEALPNNTEVNGEGAACGAFVKFDTQQNPVVKVRMGTSFSSEEKAALNLTTEINHWEVEKLQAATAAVWEEALGKVEVNANDEAAKTIFYTALYHSRLLPRTFSDVDGTYPAFDGGDSLMQAEGYRYFADYSMWDTYRAVHPLLTLLEPSMSGEMMNSLVRKAEQGGWLPIFPGWNSYTAAMIGDHVTATLGDAYLKGIPFDMEAAYPYMRQNAFVPNPDPVSYKNGKGRRALASYLQYGYIPMEDSVPDAFHQKEQASRTLEYAYNDFVLMQVAQQLGKTADAEALARRALNYRNVIDPETGYARGRYADGSWYSPYNPNASRAPFITEGSPNQYTWYVPHDVAGLMQLMGGKERFLQKLDSLFEQGYYWHGNEPGHQTIYLYNFAGEPHKTQQWVRHTLQTEYGTGPGGLSGNEDAGQMSAWYVFSALGFYPVCPGSPNYVIGAPQFEQATLHLENGNTFMLQANNLSDANLYIQSVTLNGQPFSRSWLSHAEILAGGELVFQMGSTPSTWGSQAKAVPPSYSAPLQ